MTFPRALQTLWRILQGTPDSDPDILPKLREDWHEQHRILPTVRCEDWKYEAWTGKSWPRWKGRDRAGDLDARSSLHEDLGGKGDDDRRSR